MEGDRGRRQDRGQGEERPPPAARPDQPGGERDEDDRGEAGDEGQDRERAAPAAAEPGRHDDEGGLVEGGGHRQADPGPDEVVGGDAVDRGPGDDQQRGGAGAGGHQGAGAVPVEPAPGGERGDAGDQEGEGVAAGQGGARPAEVVLHRGEEDGEGVVEDAPGDGLGEGEGEDEHPAVVEAGPRPRRARAQVAGLHRALRRYLPGGRRRGGIIADRGRGAAGEGDGAGATGFNPSLGACRPRSPPTRAGFRATAGLSGQARAPRQSQSGVAGFMPARVLRGLRPGRLDFGRRRD